MRIDAAIVVLCELISFTTWLIHADKIKQIKYRLFTFYLGVISFIEIMNLCFSKDAKSWSNWLAVHINVPLQFIFFIYFLLYNPKSLTRIVSIILITIYLLFYVLERLNFFIPPVNFDSLSYGIGDLLLITAIIIALVNMFKQNNLASNNQNTVFCIIGGLILYYVGAFPYQNFRNYLWSNPFLYKKAYFLHYLSQTFSSIMYLIFAFSIKWKLK